MRSRELLHLSDGISRALMVEPPREQAKNPATSVSQSIAGKMYFVRMLQWVTLDV
jgi:hypothetical protein